MYVSPCVLTCLPPRSRRDGRSLLCGFAAVIGAAPQPLPGTDGSCRYIGFRSSNNSRKQWPCVLGTFCQVREPRQAALACEPVADFEEALNTLERLLTFVREQLLAETCAGIAPASGHRGHVLRQVLAS